MRSYSTAAMGRGQIAWECLDRDIHRHGNCVDGDTQQGRLFAVAPAPVPGELSAGILSTCPKKKRLPKPLRVCGPPDASESWNIEATSRFRHAIAMPLGAGVYDSPVVAPAIVPCSRRHSSMLEVIGRDTSSSSCGDNTLTDFGSLRRQDSSDAALPGSTRLLSGYFAIIVGAEEQNASLTKQGGVQSRPTRFS